MPRIRSGVSSTRIGMRRTARVPPSRSTASSRSNRARNTSASSGRGCSGLCVCRALYPRACRARFCRRNAVGDQIGNAASIAATNACALQHTREAIALRQRRQHVKLRTLGRTGQLARPGWRPYAGRYPLPSASGRIIWLRNSSGRRIQRHRGRDFEGLETRPEPRAATTSAISVAAPRNQRALPIASARSGVRSSPYRGFARSISPGTTRSRSAWSRALSACGSGRTRFKSASAPRTTVEARWDAKTVIHRRDPGHGLRSAASKAIPGK